MLPFSAEFGNNGGTIVNMVLKQGSNSFHGSGWWYGQRSAFDARDYFNSGPKPDHLRDQYGFALGGPIKKSKTFFFVDFEKVRQQDPVNIEGTVPTDLERTGDFSQSVQANPGGIFDPTQCVGPDPCTRPEFSDGGVLDKIPASKMDPLGDDAMRRRIAIRTDLVPGLAKVKADRVQLQQVVLNLMINGMDAMAETTDRAKELLISARGDESEIVVRVEDSGMGLDTEAAEKIFNPFFTTKPYGIGMGLSISRSIIESHEGRLWASVRPSGGAIFQFTLPVHPRDSDG